MYNMNNVARIHRNTLILSFSRAAQEKGLINQLCCILRFAEIYTWHLPILYSESQLHRPRYYAMNL